MTRYSSPDRVAQEKLSEVADCKRRLSVGLPAMRGDRRFPLTPEAAAVLVEKGVTVKVENGAAQPIHYGDAAYRRHGVGMVGRDRGSAV